jgi:site-specific DNA-cytosine methylase
MTLVSILSVEVLVTLTTDAGRVLSKLHQVQPKGNNSKMNNGIYFKIAGYVDLDVLIIFTPCQIFDITNGF